MNRLAAILVAGWMLAVVPVWAQENDVKTTTPPTGSPSSGPRVAVGPDGFGYTAADETEPTGPTFNFIDISGTGTATGLSGDDAGTAALPIGFAFDFYGTTYTDVAASTNGYLNFDTAGDLVDFGNDCPGLNAFDPDQSIYAYWDDLAIDGGVGDLFYENFAVCPNTSGGFGACTVFQWNQVRHLGDTQLFDFQAILYDTNNILIQMGANEPEAGVGATIGIENQTPSSIGLDYACNTAGSMPANRGVLFCAPGNTCPAAAPVPQLESVSTLSWQGLFVLAALLAAFGALLLTRRIG
jgi:hypothetical protein